MIRTFLGLSLAAGVLVGPALAQDVPPVRLGASFTVSSLDPSSLHYWTPDYGASELLMQFRPDGNYHPWLLESLEAHDDDTRWVLTLRPGVTFQNGAPLDAEAVKRVIERQLAVSRSAAAALPEGTKIDVTSDLSLTVTSPVPFAGLPGVFTQEELFPIYDAAAVEAMDGDWSQMLDSGVHTGPYRLIGLDDNAMTLERFDDYWQGQPALPGVVVNFVPNAQSRILAVQNDEIDIALLPPISARRIAEATPGLYLNNLTPSTGGFMILPNTQAAPFDDPAVRRALVLGIDYEEMANDVFGGDYRPASGLYNSMFPFAIQNQATDLDAANALLDAAGWERGANGLRRRNGAPLAFTLLIYPAQPDLVPLSTALQHQLRAIGMDVSILSVDSISDAVSPSSDLNWGAALWSTSTANWGRPEGFLQSYVVEGGHMNYGGYANDEVNRLTTEFLTAPQDRRDDILEKIQTILVEEDPYAINLVFDTGRVIVNEAYRNFQAGYNGHHITWQTAPSTD